MTTRDLLDALESRGVRLGYRLTVAAPKGAIDADLRQRLADRKPEIVEAMARADRLGNPTVTHKDLLNCDRDGFDWALGVQRDLEAAAGPSESFDLVSVDGEPVGELSELDRRALAVDWSRPDPLTETAKLVAAEQAATARPAGRKPRASKATGSPLLDNTRGGDAT